MFCEIPPKPPGWGPKALKAIKAIRLALPDDSPIPMTVVAALRATVKGQPVPRQRPRLCVAWAGVLSLNRYNYVQNPKHFIDLRLALRKPF